MSYSSDVVVRTVYGQFLGTGGSFASGSVTFSASTTVEDDQVNDVKKLINRAVDKDVTVINSMGSLNWLDKIKDTENKKTELE